MTRKLGLLPVWAWAAIVAVVGYFLYRHFSSSSMASTNTAASATSPSPAPATTGDTSTATTGTSPTLDTTSTSASDLVSALGGQQASLLAALEQANQDVLGLAQTQIAAAQGNGLSPSSTSETQPVTGSQPGGSNAPSIFYVSPQAAAPTSSTPAPAASTVRSSAAGSAGSQPYGGVVSTVRTKTGTIITKYASGRIVEQAPGKSAYVAKA